MQTVALHSPSLTPAFDAASQMPCAPEGGFLASFEAEPGSTASPGDPAAGSPVMVMIPVVLTPLPGLSGAGAVLGPDPSQVTLAGEVQDADGPGSGADLRLVGAPGLQPDVQGPDAHSADKDGQARSFAAAEAVQLPGPANATPGQGLAQGGGAEPAAGATASPAQQTGGSARPPPETVGMEAGLRAEAPGTARSATEEGTGPGSPATAGSVTAPSWNGPAAASAPQVQSGALSVGAAGPAALPTGMTVPIVPDAGSESKGLRQVVSESGTKDGGQPTDMPPGLAEGDQTNLAQIALEDTTKPNPEKKPVRAGLWESMFSTLSLPLPAARGGSPVLPAVPAPAIAAVLPIMASTTELHPWRTEHPVEPTGHQPNPAPTTVPQTTSSTLAPAVALWSPGTSWLSNVTNLDEATGDDTLPLPLVPGSMATGGVPNGAPVAQMTSSPVPQAAAQMAAALSHSADGATELALSPDELGHVRLRLEPDAANPDRMVVMITFERPETLDLFRRHAGELADALRAAGYAGADIGFGQDRSGAGGQDGPAGRASAWGIGADQPDPAPLPPPAPRLAAGASLDLRL